MSKEEQTNKNKYDQYTDFGRLLKTQPCSRQSLMYGISGGLGIGLLRYYMKPNVLGASNYAVGSFVIISTLFWNYCTVRTIDMAKRSHVIHTKKPTTIKELKAYYENYIQKEELQPDQEKDEGQSNQQSV